MSELSSGWGRALVFVYGIFAVAATGRSLVQLAPHAGDAPLAYSLSLLAAVVYVIATTCLVVGGARGWRVALVSVCVELVGVVSIGALSLAREDLFPDQTVWSGFGEGYGFVPLVLPFLGLAWLWSRRPSN